MPTYLDPRLGISYSEAIAESMASNVQGDPILLTLEIRNVNFGSVYIVNDLNQFVAYDENGALRVFQPVPFRYTRPEQTDNGQPAGVQIEIDNVTQILTTQLLTAGRDTTYIVEREYLPSDNTAPHVLPPTTMVLTDVRATPETVTGLAVFGDFSNRRFPFNTYTRERFPSLAAT